MAIVVVQLGLVFVFCLAYGEAFITADWSEAERNMTKCPAAHQLSQDCYDDKNLETCLQNILPEEQDLHGKNFKEYMLKAVEKRKSECPGFVGELVCRNSESKKCKDDLRNKKRKGDQSVCQETQLAKDCLVRKLNDSCADEVIRQEMLEIEDLDRECQTENFNGGPCSGNSIQACLFRVVLEVGGVCDKTRVEQGNKCLDSLEKKCKTDQQQELIVKTRFDIRYFCGK